MSATLTIAIAVMVVPVVVSGWGKGDGDPDGGPSGQLSAGLHGQDRPRLLVTVVLPGHANVQALLLELPTDS